MFEVFGLLFYKLSMESLVPTPDVFVSRIADCTADGILAFATRKSIALINVTSFPPVFKGFIEHPFRVSALRFSKGRNRLLVSGCDDGTIQIWDISHSRGSVASFDNPTKVLAVEWQYNADNIVFSADERSFVIEWNTASRSSRALRTRVRNSVFALSSCQHDPSLLAAGHKCGDISIIDVSTASVRYQLRAHSDNIIHVAWSPHSGDQLLSTSKDNSIRIWSVDKEDTLHLFSSISPMRGGLSTVFSAIWHPQDPNLIICSSQNFVGTWNLKSSGKPKVQSYDSKNGMRHFKSVSLIDINNFSKNIIFSISVDRLIIFWDIEERKAVYQLSTLGGSVYDLAFSPVAVGRLGVAVGDSNVRVWNVASSTTCPTQNFFVGTRSRVTTIAWHPEKENIIAFGTDDGRVGFIDVNSRKTTNISGNLHKTKVYKLSWGPCHLKTGGRNLGVILYLYSCGDGPVFIHSFGKDDTEETVDFDELRADAGYKDEDLVAGHHTEVSWKPDFSWLAVGNNDGCIGIYHGSTFALLARLQAQKKLIQNLQWHPTFTSLSSSPSSLNTWLACASYETTIHVYDLTLITKSDSDTVIEVLSSTRELVGHTNKVSALVWSPHLEGRLASASYDHTAQVWDVISGESLANFRDHKTRILAIAWNVFDPDILFTGGDDYLVLQWRISEQTHIQPPSKGRERGSKKKKSDYTESLKTLSQTVENSNLIGSSDFQESEECVLEMNNDMSAELAVVAEPLTSAEGGSEFPEPSELETSPLSDDKKSISKEKSGSVSKPQSGGRCMRKKKKGKNMMPVYGNLSRASKSRELLDCIKLAEKFSRMDVKNGSLPDFLFEESDTAHLAFFGNQEVVLQWLNVEGAHHRDVGNFAVAYELEVWKGNTGAAIREAAERGDLNEFLVSLAPSVSHSLWIEMCESYAKQLVQDKSYQKAALYLLTCGKIYEAIDLLKDKSCFRDALAIAKARLPSSDPVIKDIISTWCTKLLADGNTAIAAQWYIALNQPLKAASLFSDLDAQHLQIAAFICLKYGYLSEAKEYAVLCLKRSLLNKKWDIARQMIDEQWSTMNVYRTLVAVHEFLMNHIDILQNETERYGITEKVFHNFYQGSHAVIWRSYLVREQNFLVHVLHSLMSQGLIPTKQEKLLEEIEAVSLLRESPGVSHSAPNQAMMFAGIDLVLFYLTLLSEKEEKFAVAANYLNSLFRNCVASNYHSLLNNICLFSLPFDVIFNSDDLVMSLEVVGINESELLKNFFLWLQSTIIEQRLLNLVVFSETFSANIFNEAEMKLSALTSVESILAYFFINFLVRLEVLICEKNFHAKCYYKFQMESDDAPEVNRIPQKLHCGSDVQELPSDSMSCVDDISNDMDTVLQDLLLTAEKKIDFLTRQSCVRSRSEGEVMANDKVSATECCDFSADNNIDLTDQSSMTVSSVDLAISTYYEHHPEFSDNDYDFKGHIENHNEKLLTQFSSVHVENSACLTSERPENETSAFRNMLESSSSHTRCLHSLKFYFYFVNRVACSLCNDSYALLFYLKNKLKRLQNIVALKTAGCQFDNTPTVPHLVHDKGDILSHSHDQFQSAVETSDSLGPVWQPRNSSQQVNSHLVSDSVINSEKPDGEELLLCVSDEELDLASMQKTCKEIIEFLDAFVKKDLVFPDALHASSQILGLCNLMKERNSCQCIEEKMNKFMLQVTSWAAKFNVNKPLLNWSHRHSLCVDETGDHKSLCSL